MNFLRFRKILSNVLVSLISLMVIIPIVEVFFKILYSHSSRNIKTSHYEYRMSRPEPYRDSEFFSEEFLRESFYGANKWVTPEGTRIVIPQDFDGKWFKIRDGKRLTPNSLGENDAKNIFVYGGSTVFCSEVPDEYTLPNMISKELLVRGIRYNVVNMGATTVHSAQQYERLIYEDNVKGGDIVIFYDGVNDIIQYLYYGRPEGWIIGYNREVARKNMLVLSLFSEQNWLVRNSYFFKYLRLLSTEIYIPEHFDSEEKMRLLYGRLFDDYNRVHMQADLYSKSRGASFFHFLQPQLFAKVKHTTYENNLLKNHYIVPIGMADLFESGYAILRKSVRLMKENGVFSYDISNVLDEVNSDVYLDYCHVNEVANRKIAQKIVSLIFVRDEI